MNAKDPLTCHDVLFDHAPKVLAFDGQRNFAEWRRELAGKLKELLGVMPQKAPLQMRMEYERTHEQFYERRFTFETEADCEVPCHLLIPRHGDGPFPTVICLQGHSTGMHISLGRMPEDADKVHVGTDRDYAIQAIQRGWAALVIEQRCFGERRARHVGPEYASGCQQAAMQALLLGRTMIGERVWDVRRALDILETFSEVDMRRLVCVGDSGGGTITYYLTCVEPRIAAAIPAVAVCTYKDSIGRIYHCTDNYIPGVYQYFEMGDLAGLIAPRPLIIVAGRHDDIFPIAGVEENFAIIQRIYDAADASDRCRLVVGEGGHRFYAQQAWHALDQMVSW